MLEISVERRDTPRFSLHTPCKVFDPRAARYHAGSTCDISRGGVQIQLDRAASLSPGDTVFVGIAQTRRHALLKETGGLTLGIQFHNPTDELPNLQLLAA